MHRRIDLALLGAACLAATFAGCATTVATRVVAMAWAPKSAAKATPVAGAKVTVRCKGHAAQGPFVTDARGVASVPVRLARGCEVIVAEKRFATKAYRVAPLCRDAASCEPVVIYTELLPADIARSVDAMLDLERIARSTTRPTIESKPPKVFDGHPARFTFSCDKPPCEFECALGAQGSKPRLLACTSPWTSPKLSDGRYGFWVRSRKNGVDGYAARYRFAVTTRRWLDLQQEVFHTCGLTVDHHLWCWGEKARPSLGRPRASKRPPSEPTPVAGNATCRSFSVGSSTTCAVRTDGTLWCWGGRIGALGYEAHEDVFEPRQVGTASDWASVVTGDEHSCAMKKNGALWCWGANAFGAVGDGTGKPGPDYMRIEPTEIRPGSRWRSVALGQGHSCGIQVDGSLWCWGEDTWGVLGISKGEPRLHHGQDTLWAKAPLRVGRAKWRSIATGDHHTCGVQADGSLWCWGERDEGQLGIGWPPPTHGLGPFPDTSVWRPVRVGKDEDWRSVFAHDIHTCATKNDGSVWCWGGHLRREKSVYFASAPTPTRLPGVGKGWKVVEGAYSICLLTPEHTLVCHRVTR